MGRENGVFPILEDGVYFLTRIDAGPEPPIWEAKTIRSANLDQSIDAGATIGIAPRHEKRFAYFWGCRHARSKFESPLGLIGARNP